MAGPAEEEAAQGQRRAKKNPPVRIGSHVFLSFSTVYILRRILSRTF
jgi:hypothetical protein